MRLGRLLRWRGLLSVSSSSSGCALLLSLCVRQLSQEVVPLHFSRQAKVTTLLLELTYGILKRGIEPDSPLKVILSLLVHIVRVLNLRSVSGTI